jgi:hypothetical protein
MLALLLFGAVVAVARQPGKSGPILIFPAYSTSIPT